MLNTNLGSKKNIRVRWEFSRLSLLMIVVVLLLGGGIGMLLPSFISKILPAIYRFGAVIAVFGNAFWGLVIGTLILAVIIILRQDEFAATIVLAASVILDWYLHFNFTAMLMAIVLLLTFFLARSPRYPWVKPRAMWLWVLFLVLIVLAAIRGSLTVYETLYYFDYITFGAFIMFWLGTVIARNITSTRLFFKLLTGFGTLIAIHAIIQATTGKFLFWSSLNNNYYASLSNFVLVPGLDTQRIGSFLLNPDWSGPFFAFMLFITLGLYVESISLSEKLLYILEVFLLIIALLFTYTFGAFIGAFGGIIVLIILIGSMRYRILLFLTVSLFAVIIVVFFPHELNLLQLRSTDSSIRFGAWETALRIIRAFPLTGIGLGSYNYLARAEPFRVPAQVYPLGHPLNSYLEFAAEGGIPVFLAFVALISFALWVAFRNWTRAEAHTRALLGGCIAAVITLSIDSLTNNIWTIPPLATLGWLVLGIISSPSLTRDLEHQAPKEPQP